mmetsp:Transcript_13/g.48  ORF Transcript_13/g.48 Transcript_13/m.48 type:complete len:346 (+) Transcript_13:1257-2294(+)
MQKVEAVCDVKSQGPPLAVPLEAPVFAGRQCVPQITTGHELHDEHDVGRVPQAGAIEVDNVGLEGHTAQDGDLLAELPDELGVVQVAQLLDGHLVHPAPQALVHPPKGTLPQHDALPAAVPAKLDLHGVDLARHERRRRPARGRARDHHAGVREAAAAAALAAAAGGGALAIAVGASVGGKVLRRFTEAALRHPRLRQAAGSLQPQAGALLRCVIGEKFVRPMERWQQVDSTALAVLPAYAARHYRLQNPGPQSIPSPCAFAADPCQVIPGGTAVGEAAAVAIRGVGGGRGWGARLQGPLGLLRRRPRRLRPLPPQCKQPCTDQEQCHEDGSPHCNPSDEAHFRR